jgi:tetratricopeptide (TPR) repeat protein
MRFERALTVFTVAVALVAAVVVHADEIDGEVAKRLSAAQDSLDGQRYAEARMILARLNPKRLNPAERSRIAQLLASVDQAEGNLPAARSHLLEAIADGGLTPEEERQAYYQVAQLYIADEKWADGARLLEEWIRGGDDAGSQAYYLLGIAYYQMEDYARAATPAEKAVELAEKPQENWLQLLLAIRIQREEYALAVPVLEKLVAGFPDKKPYWIQLSSVQAALGEYAESAAVLQLAMTAGLLTEEQDWRRLGELLAHVGIPHRGGRILTASMDKSEKLRADGAAQELLGNCWIAAREYEKAVPPLERAAELSQSGDLYIRLAQVEIQQEDWARATAALERAIEKGNLSNPANAELLLGIAFFSRDKLAEARPWFERAAADEAYREQAEGWLKQIEMQLAQKS